MLETSLGIGILEERFVIESFLVNLVALQVLQCFYYPLGMYIYMCVYMCVYILYIYICVYAYVCL